MRSKAGQIPRLPKGQYGRQAWITAIEALLMAAERGREMSANVVAHQTGPGAKRMPENDSSKDRLDEGSPRRRRFPKRNARRQ
jgi:hypothetical protein